MRRIKVRKHKRRLRSGGSTIVRRHNRNLNSSAKMKSRIKEQRHWEEFPSGILPVPEFSPTLSWNTKYGKPQPLSRQSIKTRIGTEPESFGFYSNYRQVGKLNPSLRGILRAENITADDFFGIKINLETKRLISSLDLSHNLELDVLERALRLHAFFPPHSRLRHIDVIVPVALYYETLEKEIVLPWSEIIKNSNESQIANIRSALIQSLREDEELYNRIRSKRYRKRRVNQLLLSLQTKFNLPPELYKTTSKNLDNHFDKLSNRKDTLLAALLWDSAIIKHFPEYQSIRTAGIRQLGVQPNAVARIRRKKEDFSFLEQSKEIKEDLWFLF